MGLNADQAGVIEEKNNAAVKEGLEKAKELASILGEEESGGGSAYAGFGKGKSLDDGDSSADSWMKAQMGSKKTVKREAASVAGMYRVHNGEKIGVAADDIFLMVKRRYGYHEKKDHFINK